MATATAAKPQVKLINPTELDMVLDAREYLLNNGGTPAELAANERLIVKYSRGTWYVPTTDGPAARRAGDGRQINRGVDYRGTGATGDAMPALPAAPSPRPRGMATERQVAYAADLFRELNPGGTPEVRQAVEAVIAGLEELTFEEISKFIDATLAALKERRQQRQDTPAATGGRRLSHAERDAQLPDVPEGRYKVNGRVYQVDKPSKGQWAGRVFIRDLSAGNERVSRHEAKQEVLAAIAKDVYGALCAYGKETGTCGKCRRPLEDPLSVHRGIGPDCEAGITGVRRKKADYVALAAELAAAV